MIRTPELATARDALATVNDMYLVYVIAHAEFSKGFGRFAPAIYDAYLPNVFADVPLARSLNFRIGDFTHVLDENRNFTSRTYFAWIHTAIEVYFSDIAARLHRLIGLATNKNSYAHRVATMLSSSLPAMIGQERADTLDYIRHRRNVLIHGSGPSAVELPKLSARIRPALPSYYASLGYPIAGVDFRAAQLDQFTYDEVIDLLRLARHCLIEFDAALLKLVGKRLLQAELNDAVRRSNVLKSLDSAKALQRARGPVAALYGMVGRERASWFT